MKDLVLTQLKGKITQQSSKGNGSATGNQDGHPVHVREVTLALALVPATPDEWKALETLFPFCKRTADLIAGDDDRAGVTLVANQKLAETALRVHYGDETQEPALGADNCEHKGKAKLSIDEAGEGLLLVSVAAKFPSLDVIDALIGCDVRITLQAAQVTVQHAADDEAEGGEGDDAEGGDEEQAEPGTEKAPPIPRRKKGDVMAAAVAAINGVADGRMSNEPGDDAYEHADA